MFTFFCHSVPSQIALGVVFLPVLLPELTVFVDTLSFANLQVWIWSVSWSHVGVCNILHHHLSVWVLDGLPSCPVACFEHLGSWCSPSVLDSFFNHFLAVKGAIELNHGDLDRLKLWSSLGERHIGGSPLVCLFDHEIFGFILYNNIFIFFLEIVSDILWN